MAGVTESDVLAFYFARKAERKRGARIDQSSRLFLAMRDRTIREQRARQLEQDADRWEWEGLWG
jgi:hypothetical protein